jgi:AcrR family transcriptional regulator
MASKASRSAGTQRRLLEAAGEVFAEAGFRSATIQKICRRAGANIAAAHYHFGDKERLYAAVIEYADRCATEQSRWDTGLARAAGPEDRLRVHVESFLSRLLDQGRPAWHAKLMAREMIDPTAALDRLVREKIRANHEQLSVIVRELMGPKAPADTVRRCVLSIVGQCLFYRHSAPVIARLYPDLVPGKEVARIADHVTRFSLEAIRGLRSSKKGGRS